MVDADIAAQVVPYIVAAAGAYGTAVVQRVQDSAADSTADATVGLGRRVLRRILRREQTDTAMAAAVEDLADDPTDVDRVAAIRVQLRKALAADPDLAAEIAGMLRQAGPNLIASGNRSAAVGHNTGIVQTGDNGHAWQRYQ